MATPLTHDDPQQLGPYRLVARLGSGGMGTVYLARSAGGRTVALKTMHADLVSGEAGTAGAEFRTRFRLETDAARVIGDHYGAEVVDADPLAETPWLATEYVLGPPLDEAVAVSGPLPETTTRALGAALCEALGQLHRSGVVHRDLKPSNILLTAAGPKVIDFGIARAAGDDHLTRTGTAAGTPAFMSPEQASGVEHTPVGDVFALAGVLVFACTGHGPFGGGQAADLLYRVRYGEADLSGVPAGLLPLLQRCLTKEPETRPGTDELALLLAEGLPDGTAADFADQLPDALHADILRRAAVAWQPQPPRLPSPEQAAMETEVGAAPGPSRRKVLALAGAGAVAVGGAGVGAWAYLRDDEKEPEAKPKAKKPKAPKELWTRPVVGGGGAFSLATGGNYVLLLTTTGGGQFVDARNGKLRGVSQLLSPSLGIVGDDSGFYSVGSRSVSGEGTHALFLNDPETGDSEEDVVLNGADVKGTAIEGSENGIVLMRASTRWVTRVYRDKKTKKKVVEKTPWTSQFVAADMKTGELLWGYDNKSPDTGPSYATALTKDEALIRVESTLTCIDARSGEVRWTWKAPAEDRESLAGLQQFPTAKGHVLLGLRDLTALRLSDGEVGWSVGEGRDARAALGPGTRLYGTPAVKDGKVYVVENGNGLIAIDGASGEVEWEARADWAGPQAFIVAPVVGKKYAYVGTGGRDWVQAVDLEEHRTAWSYRGPEDNERPMVLAQDDAKVVLVVTAADVRGLPLQ
ncbi:protein kinase domain-containing protein [Streptomyces sp. CMB-StM0423]|uniref:serine/threonine-protein kinase n=1 Tax=Streptomyces sp. CMB-StM0423 TaxID=2059884 RepID=UPI000C6FE965|nr:serine/threonine-protein kinase [Streptomyces sp. CMB-StM0423]AUH40168.1 serine/threonine protein kinase [Streptomyces sp. CMB-StM0423]